MIIKTVCGSGLGSSMLVAMNVRKILDKNNIEYDEVEHTNVSSFTATGVDFVVVGADIAPVLDIEESKKIILMNILSLTETEEKLKEKLKF